MTPSDHIKSEDDTSKNECAASFATDTFKTGEFLVETKYPENDEVVKGRYLPTRGMKGQQEEREGTEEFVKLEECETQILHRRNMEEPGC